MIIHNRSWWWCLFFSPVIMLPTRIPIDKARLNKAGISRPDVASCKSGRKGCTQCCAHMHAHYPPLSSKRPVSRAVWLANKGKLIVIISKRAIAKTGLG